MGAVRDSVSGSANSKPCLALGWRGGGAPETHSERHIFLSAVEC